MKLQFINKWQNSSTTLMFAIKPIPGLEDKLLPNPIIVIWIHRSSTVSRNCGELGTYRITLLKIKTIHYRKIIILGRNCQIKPSKTINYVSSEVYTAYQTSSKVLHHHNRHKTLIYPPIFGDFPALNNLGAAKAVFHTL